MKSPAVAAFLLFLLPAPGAAQRLPSAAVPVHYDISVEPNLGAASFEAAERIDVTLAAPATAIVLNAAEITFKDVSITAGGRTQRARVTLDAEKEQATLSVPAPIAAGPATIEIAYAGRLNDDLRGLYLSKANNRRYAITQMEATDARRMFPSFDEPAYKATFALTAVIDQGDTAISNGAVISDEPGPRPGKHTVKFATSPKMSSYLVALAVGDFVCNEGASDGIPIRICSTPDKKALTGFALEAAQHIVQYYDQYYSVKYPFKKLDIVAVPDFSAGAMENTAAIFYRETLLLAEPNAGAGTRYDIAVVLAHEIAHQWFGDLVTMQWWDDIWLNEGFANWMMSKPLKAWHPEWHVALSETADNQKALRLDALESTRPIRSRATTPAEINELFDPIAYEKGAAVLRMVESWVGEEPFRAGVNAYIDRFKYGNARAEDFWATLTASTSKPVDRVMRTFVDQPGFPLISVDASCSAGKASVALTQQRYRMTSAAPSTGQVWQVPVCLHTPDGGTSCEILDTARKTVVLRSCSPWTMPNADGRGYYRSSIAPAALKALAGHVADLSGPERLTLIADEWALVRAGTHDVGSYLDLASHYKSERSAEVLSDLAGTLTAIAEQLTTPATRPAFQAWVSELLTPAAQDLGWTFTRSPSASAAEDDARTARATLMRELGLVARDPRTIEQARTLVERELAKPGTVEPTLLSAAVTVAARSGDAALYEQYLARAKASVDPEERYRYLYALTSFSDPALVRRTMEYVLGPDVRSQDTKLFIASLLTNEQARDVTWDLLRERWSAVQQKTGEFVGNTVIVSALSSFCSAGRAKEIKTFFAAHPVPDAERTLAQTLERIDRCAALAGAQAPGLAAWLDGRDDVKIR